MDMISLLDFEESDFEEPCSEVEMISWPDSDPSVGDENEIDNVNEVMK